MAADGMTNREIAQALLLTENRSRRTCAAPRAVRKQVEISGRGRAGSASDVEPRNPVSRTPLAIGRIVDVRDNAPEKKHRSSDRPLPRCHCAAATRDRLHVLRRGRQLPHPRSLAVRGRPRGRDAAVHYIESAIALAEEGEVELELIDTLAGRERVALLLHERFKRPRRGCRHPPRERLPDHRWADRGGLDLRGRSVRGRRPLRRVRGGGCPIRKAQVRRDDPGRADGPRRPVDGL